MTEQPKGKRVPAKTAKEVAEEHAPWKPTQWEPADAAALQALMRGDCPPHLQQRAIKFIMWELCGVRDLNFYPGGQEGERDTSFALGKRFVGLQIAKLIEIKVKPGGEQI